MWILGFIFLCIIILTAALFLGALFVSRKDIARYYRMRRM